MVFPIKDIAMTSSPSLAGRFFLAIVLMIGFYILALAICGVLLYLPYIVIVEGNRLPIKMIVFCLAGTWIILRSIMPRPDRFTPPGPRLTKQEHPKLHEAVEQIAQATQQAPPVEIYLVPEVNAWVSQRGGIMGIGSRRVMGLGLPLMQTLTASQFRAVLAHEFGHFYGGDTSLGPWIYKTNTAIARTLEGLSIHSSWLNKPFELYGMAFIRITHAISRRQEYIADRLAAQVVGSRAFGEGLKQVHGATLAFSSFLSGEFVPAIGKGYRPPFSQGFQQFMNSTLICEQVDAALQQELKEGKSDPYDTHPQLAQRLEALNGLPQGELLETDPLSLSLLNNIPELEEKLFAIMIPDHSAKPKPIQWEELPEKVWLPIWAESANDHAQALRGLTPASLPECLASPKALAVRLKMAPTEALTMEEHEQKAVFITACALCVLFHMKGWKIDSKPGCPVMLCDYGNALEFHPFQIPEQLKSGALTPEHWKRICDAAEVGEFDLGDIQTISGKGAAAKS
jgi:heat shock protein HtpX